MAWREIARRPVGGRLAQLGGALVIHHAVDQDTTVRGNKVIGHGASVERRSAHRRPDTRIPNVRDEISRAQIARRYGHIPERFSGEHQAMAWFDAEHQVLLASVADQLRDKLRHLSAVRSEEHTSELQSLRHLVCRLLLEKKKNKQTNHVIY